MSFRAQAKNLAEAKRKSKYAPDGWMFRQAQHDSIKSSKKRHHAQCVVSVKLR